MDPETHNYYPILYKNEFWLMTSHLIQVNATAFPPEDIERGVAVLPLTMTYDSIGMWRWQVQSGMEKNWANQAKAGIRDDSGTDELKR